MLEKFKAILTPEGSILLDVYSLNAYDQKEESATYEKNHLFGFWSPNDYYAFVNSFKYDDEKVVLDKYTIIEDNKPIREVYNWLQHFDPEMSHDELESDGLIIYDYYANVAGDEFNPSNDEFAIQANHKR